MVLIGSGGIFQPYEYEVRDQIAGLNDEEAATVINGGGGESADEEFDEEALIQAIFGQFYHDVDAIPPSVLERAFVLGDVEANQPSATNLLVNYIRNHVDVEGIETISIPTLLLWGEFDKVSRPPVAKIFNE